MNEFELDAELAAANPLDEDTAASVIPPAVGEAMLREITHSQPAGLWQRVTRPLAAGVGPARLGFVGVLAVVALAVSALTVLSLGGGGDELAESAGQGEVEECQASGSGLSEAREAYRPDVYAATVRLRPD